MVILLCLVCAILWAIYPTIISHNTTSKNIHPIVVWAVLAIVAGAIALVVLLFMAARAPGGPSSILPSAKDLAILTLASAIGYGIGNLLYVYLINRSGSPTSYIMTVSFTAPFFATLMGVVLFHEHLRWWNWVGLGMITSGIGLASFRRG